MSTVAPTYPVRVEGRLDPGLSRWLWLFKWLLVIPHYLVLMVLWTAFAVLSVVAFFAILFTGRYPRGIFDFNVGVLRWTWRVAFYAFGANGTDRYPPFSLAEADYPATLAVEYPQRLSRGLLLVKWWLLAIPHYIVVALFLGGGTWAVWQAGDQAFQFGGGLVGVLVLIAVVVLLFTGRYPRGIFDLVLGMDRWALRVAAYAGLMTDRYPPFRLDLGGSDPSALDVGPEQSPPSSAATAMPARWSGGRVSALVAGSVAALVAAGLLAAGVAGLVVDQTQRDGQGFVTTTERTYSTGTYALVTETATVDLHGPDWGTVVDDLVGDVQVRSTSDRPVFVGIARARDLDAYLAGVSHETLGDLADASGKVIAGNGRPAAPEAQKFWAASTSGPGEQTLRWSLRDGEWKAVMMAADGTRGVSAQAAIGAELPALPELSLGLVLGGALLLTIGGALLVIATRRRDAGSLHKGSRPRPAPRSHRKDCAGERMPPQCTAVVPGMPAETSHPATRILVAFASKHGSTAEIADVIAEQLRQHGLHADLRDAGEVQDLAGYHAVVLGSAVYMKRWKREARHLLHRHRRELASIPFWIFSSGQFGEHPDPAWSESPRVVREAQALGVRDHAVFGGRLPTDPGNYIERAMVRDTPADVADLRDWDAIRTWADGIAAEMREETSSAAPRS
jgi:menaquinone-dependent protoporphyrinogen IX oxidase